jgi:pimeloyl-ACP methyl ester carboxylesterase
MLRIYWSPDGREISFFSMRSTGSGRELYVWHLGGADPEKINIPLTTAETKVAWAPDGRALAFTDPREGLIVVGIAEAKKWIIVRGRIDQFDWSPDSSAIAFVDTDDPTQIEVIHLSTDALEKHHLARGTKILDIAFSPRRNVVLLVVLDSSGAWCIQEMSLTTWRARRLVKSRNALAEPTWFPDDRDFCFTMDQNLSRIIYVGHRASKRIERLSGAAGLNDIRGVLPDSSAIYVAHRDANPVALYLVQVSSARFSVVFRSRSNTLLSVEAVPDSELLSDGSRVRLLVWRSPFRPSQTSTIIRIQGNVHTMESPVWQEQVQLAMKHGVNFIAVNYREFGTTRRGQTKGLTDDQRVDDIVGAIDYAHEHLQTPYARIVLLGHSTGANLAASVAQKSPEKIGLLALVSFQKPTGSLPHPISRKSLPRTIVFYPQYDTSSLQSVEQNLLSVFGPLVYDDHQLRIYVMRDDHNLMYPSSWGAVYSTVLAQLRLATCVAPFATGGSE